MRRLVRTKPYLGQAVAFLISNGVTPDFEGFNYIVEAVAIWADYEESVPPLCTKEVYPVIGKKYGKSWGSVERAVRLCVERVTATPQRLDRCVRCLGTAPEGTRYRNAEFLALLTHYVLWQGGAA